MSLTDLANTLRKAMTKEKLQFLLPVVFTVGPDVNQRGANAPIPSAQEEQGDHIQLREDKGDSLMKYAMLLAGKPSSTGKNAISSGREHLESIIKGIIEGEVRV